MSKARTKYVTVRLTLTEALTVAHAASYWEEVEEVAEEAGLANERRSARSASNKLLDAVAERQARAKRSES